MTEISSEEMSVKIFSLEELNLAEIIYVLIRPRADATLRQLFTYAHAGIRLCLVDGVRLSEYLTCN